MKAHFKWKLTLFCCLESLRIHPLNAILARIVTIPYKLPGTEIVLHKGERVSIPVYSIHMDPNYYENPEQFDPERFKDNNHKPSSKYMPFGDGPRMCIGKSTRLCVKQKL